MDFRFRLSDFGMRPPASPSCRLSEPEAVGAKGACAPEGIRKAECGLRPLRAVGPIYESEAIGAIRAYAPEGMRKAE